MGKKAEKGLSISLKEGILTVPAVLLCFPAFFDNALPVVWLCLGASWLICMYGCYAHVGTVLKRTGVAIVITGILGSVAYGVSFKKNESTARPTTQNDSSLAHEEMHLPPTIHEYFVKDGNEGGSFSSSVEIKDLNDGWKANIGIKMSYDLNSQSKFLSLFVPSDKDHADFCFRACAYIPEHYQELVNLLNGIEMDSKNVGENEVKSAEMILSPVTYVYYDGDFSYEQLAYLEQSFTAHKLRPQFRGQDYATISWLQDSSDKAASADIPKSKDRR